MLSPASSNEALKVKLQQQDWGGALELMLAAWRHTKAPELAEAIDLLDREHGTSLTRLSTKAWLNGAAAARRPDERGALLRAIAGRTLHDTVACLRACVGWNDPRVASVIHGLLSTLPWSGRRSTGEWREIFALAVQVGDPRLHDLASTLPATWKVGRPMQTFLANQLREAAAQVAVAPLPQPQFVELLAELKPKPERGPNTEAELLAAIYERPSDDAPRAVYADWLQERGLPRGELIALDLRPTLDAASTKRRRALLAEHGKTWLGPLSAVLRSEVEFRRGFPAKAKVTFRNQRDAEQHGAYVEWATLEELEWNPGQIRNDQRDWAGYLSPVMRGLRTAINPSHRFVLEAESPWAIERLALDAAELKVDGFRAIVDSKQLPSLRELWVAGWGADPTWLAGTGRLPPQLEFNFGLDSDTLTTWLGSLEPTTVERLVVHSYPRHRGVFSRDRAGGPFCRLDLEVDLFGKDTLSGPTVPKYVQALIDQLKQLPLHTITHLTATAMERGVRVPIEAVLKAVKR